MPSAKHRDGNEIIKYAAQREAPEWNAYDCAFYGQNVWIWVLASQRIICYLLNGEVICNDGIFSS